MKIDFAISKMSGGGAERVVSILANYLDDQGHDVRIVTFTGGDNYSLNPGVKRVRLHKHPLFHSVVFNGFFQLLSFYNKKNNRPDIISSHLDLLGYLTIPVAKIYNIPIIVSEHNNHLANNNLAQKFLWNYLYKLADVVTVLTSFDLEFFRKRNNNVVLMPNPCPFDPIKQDALPNKRSKSILVVGNLDRYYQKGFDNLIPLVASVLKSNPEWTLKIIGSGNQGFTLLKNLAKVHDVSDRIVFTGQVKNVRDLLADAEIFMLPSRFEGLPMVLLEAMSQGTACISYNCISGPSDIITNDVNGILVEDQNHDKMAKKLDLLIQSTELRNRFQKEAPKALAKYAINTVGKNWEDLLHKTIAEK